MNKPSTRIKPVTFSRRGFLRTTGGAMAGGAMIGALSPERFAHAVSGTDEIKIALVGCGGRGSGAADQALSTYPLGPVKLVAMGDVHEDRLKGALNNLEKQHGARVEVPAERQFLGFDAYKKAIEQCDVAILATPPGFRPMMFEEAVKQGKHVFTEKPVATDAAGVRQFLAAAAEAKKKNLRVGVGLQRHHEVGYLETLKRLNDGQIGDITAMRCYWNGNRPWQMKRAELETKYGRKLTEMEYQLRNWYYFTWIGGDHIVEQHIHNIDVINWVKKGPPVKAHAMGGREISNGGADDGEIYDHFAVEFEYADGSICNSFCRHQKVPDWNSVSEHVIGTKGRCDVSGHKIYGENQWRHKPAGDKDPNPYQVEHDDLFTAIRNNKEYSEAVYGAESTMTAILGRMAAYSGKELEYKVALESKIELLPKELGWDKPAPVNPGPDGLYKRAVPGVTQVV
jgi:predicted dehydrogenase